MNITLPENFKIVDASAGCVTTNGGVTCDYVSLKNVIKAWIVCSFTQAVGHATGIDPKRATAVDGTGAVALANVVPIWLNEDTAASDTLVKQTSAITETVANTVKKKQVIFQIDPVDIGDFDVLGCAVDDSSQATNFVSILYILPTKYPQATPPVAITD